MPYMESPTRTEGRHLNVLVFHDQAEDPSPILRQLLKASRHSPLLTKILDTCSTALRNAQASEEWPLFDFAEHQLRFAESDSEQVAILTVVTCLAQLGSLALAWERQPSLFDPESAETSSIGLCTGSLAAAAAACASSPEDLVAISRELICIAFRLGIEAKRRSRSIDDRYARWSFIVKGVSEQEAQESLDSFHDSKNLPLHRRAYISAVLPYSLTLSGPPNTLDLLFSHDCPLSAARRKPLHICAAFHAKHLLCPDLDVILGNSNLDAFKLRPGASIGYPIVRTDNDSTLASMLRVLIEECFQEKLYIRPETNPIPPGRNSENCTIISIGQAGAGETLQDWLDIERKVPYIQAQADFKQDCLPSTEMPDQIAVTGYAGRFPQADNMKEFWDVIESGKDVHEFIPASRFNAEAHYDKLAKGRNATASPYGCFMRSPGHFDNEFFNMSPREAKQVDPIQRLLLMVTQEALEMAGYTQQTCRSKRIGTFFGQATDDYRESNAGQDIDIFYVGGGMRAFGPGRLNYHYKWEGPSYSIDTACSSSLAALEFAHRAVQSGDVDIAIAGGGNLLSALPMFSGLSKGRFTSSTGSCKTFDAGADGYCRGEGVGVVVVRRLEDAIHEGDNIKGVVSSIVTNHSAHATSITHPHGPTQEALFLRTLSRAGLEPKDIDYVEFHGTGTQAGDAAELSSVSQIFGGKRNRPSQLCVGAVKANVGHGEAAAGVTSLIKALLMIEHDTIPPHCGIKGKPNPALAKKEMMNLKIPDKPMKFEQSNEPRTILINNFNATGGNTSMILRGPPKVEPKQLEAPRSHYPVSVSANSVKSLQQNLGNLKRYVQENADVNLADVSYSTTARRLHFPYRVAFTADSVDALTQQMEQSIEKTAASQKISAPLVAFAFSGQGTQKQGIARDLYHSCAAFRQSLNEYDATCSTLGFPSFLEFLINPDAMTDWTATQLQLGTVAVELALAMTWQSWGLQPGTVVGHSLGEYPALCVAGVLSITDMFALVGERARLMEKLIKPGTHAMLSVSQSAEEVRKLITDSKISNCEISCYNAEQSVAVSGPVGDLDRLNKALEQKSIRSKKLDVKYAFHSAMIEPILERLESFASSIPFHKPRIPVASTLLGSVVHGDGTFGPQYLRKHARQPVQFVNALKAGVEANLTTDNTVWIEVGPGDASCMPLVNRAGVCKDRSRMISSFSSKTPTWELLSKSLADCYMNGVNVEWAPFHDAIENQLNFLDLPTYAFETKEYWISLVGNRTDTKAAPEVQQKLTPLLHYLEKVSLEGKEKTAEFHSDLSDPILLEAIHGHKVFDAALCPSSVYSSIALEAATFMAKKMGAAEDSLAFEIYRMEITRPLVVNDANASPLKIFVSRDQTGNTSVEFSTQNSTSTTKHAKCVMNTSNQNSWRSEWSKVDFLAKSRIDMLEQSNSDNHFKLQRPVIYKLFTHVVNYADPYHGLKKMVLDNDNQEAAAEVDFETTIDPGHAYDWHLIDTLIHLAGFILNNGLSDKEHAFISDGWDSFRTPPGLKKTGQYKAHVRLSPSADGQVFAGDAYMFEGDHVVASCSGVRFSKMKLKSLKSLLGKQAGGHSGATKPNNKPAPPPSQPQRQITSAPEPKKSSNGSGNYEKIKQIIADESGVSADQINDSSKLADLGLDSILLTQVVDQIKDQTGVEVSSQDLQAVGAISDIKSLIPTEINGSASDGGQENSNTQAQSTTEQESPLTQEVNGVNGDQSEKDFLAIFRKFIAEETGVSSEEVDKASKFDDIGVDSLLSLEILNLINEDTGEEWPSTFLKENPNVAALKKALQGEANDEDTQPNEDKVDGLMPRTNGDSRPQTNGHTKAPATNGHEKELKAKVSLLQGSSKSTATPVFLFPPGLGTVAIYTRFSKHPAGAPFYALTSPYVNNGLDPSFTIDAAVDLFLSALLETRPEGPYHLAGWSLGGCIAYEVARQLLHRGATIASLTIIDCPKPTLIADSPHLTPSALTVLGYDTFVVERHGSYPQNLKEHTVGIMNAFKAYDAVPMRKQPLFARCIQATKGSQEKFMLRTVAAQALLEEHGGNVEAAAAALEARAPDTADFVDCPRGEAELGPAGWERLVEGVDVCVVQGDHVSIFTDDTHLDEMTKAFYDTMAQGEERLKETKA